MSARSKSREVGEVGFKQECNVLVRYKGVQNNCRLPGCTWRFPALPKLLSMQRPDDNVLGVPTSMRKQECADLLCRCPETKMSLHPRGTFRAVRPHVPCADQMSVHCASGLWHEVAGRGGASCQASSCRCLPRGWVSGTRSCSPSWHVGKKIPPVTSAWHDGFQNEMSRVSQGFLSVFLQHVGCSTARGRGLGGESTRKAALSL